ncbi:MAG: hypothetical protein ABIT38_00955, partial [Gemmatimonadaceae bacterium]
MAVFVTDGAAGGVIATLTVTTPAAVPDAIGAGLEHVSVEPETEQLHPLPVAEMKVNPVGRTSVIVVVPVVAVCET